MTATFRWVCQTKCICPGAVPSPKLPNRHIHEKTMPDTTTLTPGKALISLVNLVTLIGPYLADWK